ncbi:hybrid sensor histidine kinase/response regulator [Palleronia abyssalis]|uniref:histidine kinase n=1 Tax=Palleronia abyssalis TaxID=1501240 RepID=A0A2R8BY75_9RHOB|nr:ATP-binding protein [Palleronia abyssalis]SPJ25073.1 Autoinducer 2 sensor kinase/phosphatase LuxQ [Palleronia abyssalis]
MTLAAPKDMALQEQITRIRADRPWRILVILIAMLAWTIWSHLRPTTLTLILVNLALDFLTIPLETSLRRRPTSRKFYIYCTSLFLQSVSISAVLIDNVLKHPEQTYFLSAVILLILVFNCLMVRTDKTMVLLVSVMPVFVALSGLVVMWMRSNSGLVDAPLIMVTICIALVYGGATFILMLRRSAALHAARRDAIEATRTKERFFSVIGHELRTPLNGILGVAQLAEIEAADDRGRERAQILKSSANDMSNLLTDLLDQAKLAEGKFTISPAPCELRSAVEGVVRLHADAARAKKVEVTERVAPGLPVWVRLDELRLRQILSNLLSNAIKHTPRHGTVSLALEAQNDKLVFSVEDAGPGIDEGQIATLFQPFQQLDDSASRSGMGTGLGLAISKGLALAMGGDIKASSSAEMDVGAKFTVTLPIAECAAPSIPRIPSDWGGLLAGKVILLADDHKVNRTIARGFLQRAGATVIDAQDGQQALDILGRTSVDAILLDMHMPRKSGHQVIEHLRADKRRANLVILVVSAVQDCDIWGADAVLPKPIEATSLVETLHGLLVATDRRLSA